MLRMVRRAALRQCRRQAPSSHRIKKTKPTHKQKPTQTKAYTKQRPTQNKGLHKTKANTKQKPRKKQNHCGAQRGGGGDFTIAVTSFFSPFAAVEVCGRVPPFAVSVSNFAVPLSRAIARDLGMMVVTVNSGACRDGLSSRRTRGDV